MKKSPVLFAGIAVVIIAVVAGIIITSSKKDDSMTSMTSDTSSSAAKDTASSTSTAAQAAATNAVTISKYAFGPAAITVKVGTTVTWTNQDPVRHNVASDDGTFKTGPLFGKGETYSYTFTKAGTFKYHCDPHPYMKASVVVTE